MPDSQINHTQHGFSGPLSLLRGYRCGGWLLPFPTLCLCGLAFLTLDRLFDFLARLFDGRHPAGGRCKCFGGGGGLFFLLLLRHRCFTLRFWRILEVEGDELGEAGSGGGRTDIRVVLDVVEVTRYGR